MNIKFLTVNLKRKEKKQMARKRVVSRVIKRTMVSALCMNMIEKTPETVYVSLPKMEDRALEKAVEKYVENNFPDFKYVAITERVYSSYLYSMPEEDFIKHATVVEQERRTKHE